MANQCANCGKSEYRTYNRGNGTCEPVCPHCGYNAREKFADYFEEERGPASWEK
jgi:hypothetical protein